MRCQMRLNQPSLTFSNLKDDVRDLIFEVRNVIFGVHNVKLEVSNPKLL